MLFKEPLLQIKQHITEKLWASDKKSEVYLLFYFYFLHFKP